MYRPKTFAWPKPPKAAFPYIDKVRRLPFKRYLTLPFAKQSYRITEGWFYSREENSLHHAWGHAGVDFELPKGTNVLAAAYGWAMSSYHRRVLTNKDGKPLQYKGKSVEMGLGYFVQIYHPETKRYTLYAHLEKVDPKIPYSPARRLKSGNITPSNIKVSPDSMPKHFRFVWVERGEKIGEVGDSGLCWGYDDFPSRPDSQQFPSWDEFHLHFEEVARDEKGTKRAPRDPYDIYWLAEKYPSSNLPQNLKNLGPRSLWKLRNGWPSFDR